MTKLFTGKEWSFEKLEKTWKAIKDIGVNRYGLDIYDVSFDIITDRQMVENYVSNGMPTMYKHWSFGRHYNHEYQKYKKYPFSLAYEIVVDTDPCICYLMQDNTMPMQTLVMAHAAVGHNNFFKKNYLYSENTQSDFIIEYLKYADKFIKKCEVLYNEADVMLTLDAAHSIAQNSRLPARKTKKAVDLKEHRRIWQDYLDKSRDDLDNLTYTSQDLSDYIDASLRVKEMKEDVLPEDDILYFIEKNSPRLAEWQREILRIVRTLSYYYYPHAGSQVMNEGWASYWHYTIIEDLWKDGKIDNESYMECKTSHTSVANEYYDFKPRINPYYLGFNYYKNIEKACKDPDEWDKKYLPTIAGKSSEYLDILKHAAYNFNDSDFIRQYSTPSLFKKLGLAIVEDDSNQDYYKVIGSHEPEYFLQTREALAKQYAAIEHTPHMTVIEWDRDSGALHIQNTSYNDRALHKKSASATGSLIKALWGSGDIYIEWGARIKDIITDTGFIRF